MKLSPNFTLAELTRTSYAKYQDSPSVDVVVNLAYLCAVVLQPLRDALGQPITVTSGYRSKLLNDKVGGVANSKHLVGLAADIHIKDAAHALRMMKILEDIQHVDMCLFEHARSGARWLHVQTTMDKPRRLFNYNYQC